MASINSISPTVETSLRRDLEDTAPSSDSSSNSSSQHSASSSPPSSVPSTPRLPAFKSEALLAEGWLEALALAEASQSSPALQPQAPVLPGAASVADSLPLPKGVMPGAYTPGAKPEGPLSTPSTKLAAHLLAHDRTFNVSEPLNTGTFDLHGLGWEKYYKPLKHVSVDIQPATHTSIHVMLAQKPKPLALPYAMLASVAMMAASLVMMALRVIGRDQGTAGAAASAMGADAVKVTQAQLRFDKPIVAYPAGWNPSRFHIAFDGADVNDRGEIVPQGRLRLFNFISLPGVGLAKRLLPLLNVEGEALARDGLFMLPPTDATAKVAKKDKGEKAPTSGGIPAFLEDILPRTINVRATGPKGDASLLFPVSLAALGSEKDVTVEIKPHDARYALELGTRLKKAPEARLAASLVATVHNGEAQAQVQLALAATTDAKRWPLATPVPNLSAPSIAAEAAGTVSPPESKLGALLDKLQSHNITLQSHLVVGTRLQGEEGFVNLLGDTHVGSAHLSDTVTRYRLVQSSPERARAQQFAEALGVELPVLTDLSQRIVGLSAELMLARPSAEAKA